MTIIQLLDKVVNNKQLAIIEKWILDKVTPATKETEPKQ